MTTSRTYDSIPKSVQQNPLQIKFEDVLPELSDLSKKSWQICSQSNPISVSSACSTIETESACSEDTALMFSKTVQSKETVFLHPVDRNMLPDLIEICRCQEFKNSGAFSLQNFETLSDSQVHQTSATEGRQDKCNWFSALSSGIQILSALRMVDHGEIRGWDG